MGITNVNCRAVAGLAPQALDLDRMPAYLRKHRSTCSRCRAEALRYVNLRQVLNSLSSVGDRAPFDLAHRVEECISADDWPPHAVSDPRRSVVAAVGVAAAAVSVALVAAWRRSRAVV